MRVADCRRVVDCALAHGVIAGIIVKFKSCGSGNSRAGNDLALLQSIVVVEGIVAGRCVLVVGLNGISPRVVAPRFERGVRVVSSSETSERVVNILGRVIV